MSGTPSRESAQGCILLFLCQYGEATAPHCWICASWIFSGRQYPDLRLGSEWRSSLLFLVGDFVVFLIMCNIITCLQIICIWVESQYPAPWWKQIQVLCYPIIYVYNVFTRLSTGLRIWLSGSMYILKSSGPRIDPCGTPGRICNSCDLKLWMDTKKHLHFIQVIIRWCHGACE